MLPLISLFSSVKIPCGKRLLVFALLVGPLLAVVPGCTKTSADAVQQQPDFAVLVFSKTNGFRHSSIPDGIAAVKQLGEAHGFAVEATEDSTVFTPGNLANYAAVIFLNSTGDVLGAAEQQAFEAYIQGGGGYVGVHSASDTEYDWPWYGRLVGAYFKSHPQIQEATVRVLDRTHPSTEMLPEAWLRRDEWYNFRAPPQNVQVLAELDESTYEGGEMQGNHPIAWYHAYDGGRAWYTAGGHTEESYTEALFMDHLLGGIRWAAGQE